MEILRPCRRCNGPGPFYASYLAHQNYICKGCASLSVTQSRCQDPVRLLAYRWYNALRRRGIVCSHLAQVVADVIQQWGLCSALSGPSSVDQLCIFSYFRNVPPNEAWNSVLVTRQEARSLSHMQSEDKMHGVFPESIQLYMCEQRSKWEEAREATVGVESRIG
jgi:hypothetical protein